MNLIRHLNEDLLAEANRKDFTQLAIALALGNGSPTRSAEAAGRLGASPRVIELCRKAVSGTLNQASPGWGDALAADYGALANSFLESLGSVGAYDRILADAISLPAHARIVVNVTAASGAKTDEGAVKVHTQLDIDSNLLASRKAVCEVVISDELARLSGPLGIAFIENELRKGVSAATDADLIAVITTGLSPLTAGGSLLEDLATALAALSSDSRSRFYALLSSANLKAAATAQTAAGEALYPGLNASTGGVLQGVQILPADAAGDDLVVLDANQVVMTPGSIAISSSGEANVSLTAQSTAATSLWQLNLRAVRAERFYGAKAARASAVAVVADVDYSGE